MIKLPIYKKKKVTWIKKADKLKVGFYGITGCAGCLLSVIFNEDEIMDLVELVELKAFPFIKEVNPDDSFDYIFMEGLVADNEDLKVLQRLRKNSKFLVSLGACACTGCVPAYRQFTLKENYEHLIYRKAAEIEDIKPTPVDAHVKVDYYIPGCPPDKREILTFIKNVVIGKTPKPYENPVCFECWGCRGPTKDMNLELMISILKGKGFNDKFLQDRMRTFVGLKLPMLEQVFNVKINNLKPD